MYTDYDRKLDALSEKLQECYDEAKELISDKSIGHDEYDDQGKFVQAAKIAEACQACLRH